MTDRELLEYAAKAARLEEFTCINGRYAYRDRHTGLQDWVSWDPLVDDGDALRLVVKLNLQVSYEPEPEGPIVIAIFAHLPVIVSASEDLGKDPCAATRRAIVRAAAKVGKTMK